MAYPHSVPMSAWRREIARATVLAYRRAMVEHGFAQEAYFAGKAAYSAAGGDPERAERDVPMIAAAATRDHSEWFWRPVKARIERQERYLRSTGMWPPPLLDRRSWPPVPADFA